MEIKQSDIFKLETDLINMYFPKMKPRSIKIVDSQQSFAGRAGTKLEIDNEFLAKCSKEELIELLKHELIHYWLPGHGHDEVFLNEGIRVGIIHDNAPELHQILEEQRFIGRLELRGEGNHEIAIFHKRPQWSLFFNTLINSEHEGRAFKKIRNYFNLSQKELIQKTEMNLQRLKKLERTKKLLNSKEFDEEELEKLFNTIVTTKVN